MHELTVMLKPIRDGWAITPSDGRQIVSFSGLAAKRRALHYLISHNVLGETRDVR
jgi:hypothetical protein